jgi:hypothetical protein
MLLLVFFSLPGNSSIAFTGGTPVSARRRMTMRLYSSGRQSNSSLRVPGLKAAVKAPRFSTRLICLPAPRIRCGTRPVRGHFVA